MATYSDIVQDSYLRPVPAASVFVFNRDGTDAAVSPNPVLTDSFGRFSFTAPDAVYDLEFRFAAVTLRQDSVIVGDPVQYRGLPGPAANFRVNLPALKGAAITDLTATYDRSLWTWETSAAPYVADDVNIVKANSTPLTVGAWVRQSADSLSFQQSGSTIVRKQQDKSRDVLHAFDFGAKFDGVTDDAPALNAALAAAHTQQKTLQLPSGTALLKAPLIVTDRYVRLVGPSAGMSKCILKAGVTMDALIDARSLSDVSLSPFHISDVTIDGNSLANLGLAIRYRHNSTLANMFVTRCTTGIWERDTYLSRRYNVRADSNDVCWELNGSNHSSHFDACSFNGAGTTALKIGSTGTANDGNVALLFNACDVEFGKAGGTAEVGVDIATSCEATFNGCYIGENIEGDVIRNRGQTKINGGVLYFGSTATSVLVRPLGGKLLVRGSQISGQAFGSLSKIADLQPGEVAAGNGRFVLQDVRANLSVGGDATIPGDCLGFAHWPTLAPRYGKSYTAGANDATFTTVLGTAGWASSRKVTCGSVTGANPVLGLRANLVSTEWTNGAPLYLAIVYESTKPLQVKLSSGPFGTAPSFDIGVPPARATACTYVKLEYFAPSEAVTLLEFLLSSAAVGDSFTIHRVTLCDSTVLDKADGAFGNLGARIVGALASTATQAAIKTTAGSSINAGIWTLVTLCVIVIGGIITSIIKQWGPWKKGESDGRDADFARLREEIATLKQDHRAASEVQDKRIGKLEADVESAREDASNAREHSTRADAKLQTALTACEVLLALVEREMPEAKEIPLVKRLLAQAAANDLGVGDGMRKIAMMKGVGE